MADRRRTLRRIEPLHIAFAAFWGLGMAFVTGMDWSLGAGVVASLLAWTTDGLVLLYLAAPAASILVTPSRLVVNNPYVQYLVPRHLIQDVLTEGFWTARLLVGCGRLIRLSAINPNLTRGYRNYPGHRQARLVMRMIAEVPKEGSVGDVRQRVRYVNLALAVTAAGTAIAAANCLLTMNP